MAHAAEANAQLKVSKSGEISACALAPLMRWRWAEKKRGRRTHLRRREPDFGFAVSVSHAAIAPSTAPIKAARDAPSPARTARPWIIVFDDWLRDYASAFAG
jgi:hypothetical protein